jgi:hypothetical protein
MFGTTDMKRTVLASQTLAILGDHGAHESKFGGGNTSAAKSSDQLAVPDAAAATVIAPTHPKH